MVQCLVYLFKVSHVSTAKMIYVFSYLAELAIENFGRWFFVVVVIFIVFLRPPTCLLNIIVLLTEFAVLNRPHFVYSFLSGHGGK